MYVWYEPVKEKTIGAKVGDNVPCEEIDGGRGTDKGEGDGAVLGACVGIKEGRNEGANDGAGVGKKQPFLAFALTTLFDGVMVT